MKLSRGYLILILVMGLVAVAIFQFTRNSQATPAQKSSVQEAGKLQLDVIAQVGPWPVASRLIGYRGKLWFANSVKGRNHNSADIWSFNPNTSEVRYERHLYSQDAGHPLVYNGLLYWPFEDALQSAGNGIVEVTDGKTWKPLTISNPPIYHTSQLLEWNDGLLAITGTRKAGMQLSKDAGLSWQEFYIHPTPTTHVSRLKEMIVFAGETYASLSDVKVKRLVRWTGSGFRTVNGWPLNRYFNGLTVHQDGLFGIVGRGREREVWRFDGRRSIRVGFKGPFVDLTSDGDQIWLVANDGRLWSSPNGSEWSRHGDLENGRPVSIQAVSGGIYVAGAG
ncbi:MAG: sialidase family protein, partial [Parasphingorhabdus sp.]